MKIAYKGLNNPIPFSNKIFKLQRIETIPWHQIYIPNQRDKCELTEKEKKKR